MKGLLLKDGLLTEVDLNNTLEQWYKLLNTDLVEIHSVEVKGEVVDVIMSEMPEEDAFTSVIDEDSYLSSRVTPLFRGNVLITGLPDDEGKGTPLSENQVNACKESLVWIAEKFDENMGYVRHHALMANYC